MFYVKFDTEKYEFCTSLVCDGGFSISVSSAEAKGKRKGRGHAENEEDGEKEKRKKKDSPRPNYFVSVPITNPKVQYRMVWVRQGVHGTECVCVCVSDKTGGGGSPGRGVREGPSALQSTDPCGHTAHHPARHIPVNTGADWHVRTPRTRLRTSTCVNVVRWLTSNWKTSTIFLNEIFIK